MGRIRKRFIALGALLFLAACGEKLPEPIREEAIINAIYKKLEQQVIEVNRDNQKIMIEVLSYTNVGTEDKPEYEVKIKYDIMLNINGKSENKQGEGALKVRKSKDNSWTYDEIK